MPLYSAPLAPRIATAAATAIATLAAITIASSGHAQTAPSTEQPPGVAVPPPTGEQPPGVAVPPPTGEQPAAPAPALAQPGQAAPGPAAAAPTSSVPTGAPPRHSAARHHSSGPVNVTAKVNLRRRPTTEAEIVTVIPAGSGVRVGECDGDWCQVTWNGHSGWAVAWNLNLGDQRTAGGYPGQPGSGPYGDRLPDGPGYNPYRYGQPYPPRGYSRPDLDDFGPYYRPRYYVPTPWGWQRYY
jgi:hypothetical protein